MMNVHAVLGRKLANPDFVHSVTKNAFVALAGSVILNVALLFATLFFATRPPITHYFYTNGLERPRLIMPTDVPVLTPSQTLRWTVDAVIAVYSVDFVHFREQLSQAAERFDVPGWNSWATEFRHKGNLDLLQSARLIMSAVPRSAPAIRWEGIDHGTYTYKIEFPMLVRYENTQGTKTDTLRVTVIVRRTTDPRHPDGLVITQLNAPLDTAAGS